MPAILPKLAVLSARRQSICTAAIFQRLMVKSAGRIVSRPRRYQAPAAGYDTNRARPFLPGTAMKLRLICLAFLLGPFLPTGCANAFDILRHQRRDSNKAAE